MCGIAGIVNWSGASFNSNNAVRELLLSTNYRGPDEQVVFNISNGTIGMNRLAINGLNQNLYPIVSHDKRYWSVFNGEIYNAAQLRKDLSAIGRQVQAESDGQVISEGFAAWGLNFFDRIRGMWAIAIWDSFSQSLIIARDPIGIKPLFYITSSLGFAFSSEAWPLYQSVDLNQSIFGRPQSVRSDVILSLFDSMYINSNESTVFEGVTQVRPGEIVIVDKNGVNKSKCVGLAQPGSRHDLDLEEIDDALNKAIKRHLISDVPLGLLLSGGIDSSLMYSIAQKHRADPIVAFTADFVDDLRSEAILAREFTGSVGATCNLVKVDSKDIAKNLDKYIPLYRDLLTLDGGLITTSILSSEIQSRGFKVAMFGEGADEVFGGYTWFGLGSGLYKYLPRSLMVDAHSFSVTRSIRSTIRLRSSLRGNNDCITNFQTVQNREISLQLPVHLLTKVDRGTMSHSVEGRVPFLDLDLVNLVISLNEDFVRPQIKFGLLPDSMQTKPLLRSLASRYLPPSIVGRPKKGFMLPLDSVVTESASRIHDLLKSSNSIVQQIDSKAASRAINSLRNGSLTTSEVWRLWRYLIVESVFEQYSSLTRLRNR